MVTGQMPSTVPDARHSHAEQALGSNQTRRRDGSSSRKSIFTETGLAALNEEEIRAMPQPSRPRNRVRFRSQVDIHEAEDTIWEEEEEEEEEELSPNLAMLDRSKPSMTGLIYVRLGFFTFLLAFLIPLLHNTPLLRSNIAPFGAHAGPVPPPTNRLRDVNPHLIPRQDTATDICTRWSHQTALVNGTLYIYGGRSTTDSGQDSNTWNNDFVALDLKSSWQITSPSLTGLPKNSELPAVANGYLWNSRSQLFLYGGEYSDNPAASPAPYALWTYDIPSSSWSSSPSPTSSPGENSDGGKQPVQQSAEGAGINIAELGRGYYFGGHLDGYTTAGWSQQIARVYLRSMIEFTFPGYENAAIDDSPTAGPSGLWRNITTGGLQESAGFTERADGILTYVPGYGKQGIILGLAGGTDATFTQMNVIDVYDIATSTWYKQSTAGKTPKYRVNPCSVAVSAPDGTSTNIYMFGGQNLLPYGQQTQYDDMWILSIPSFTWIEVDTSTQAVPPPRAGHSCNIWNSQMVVVGGYVGQEISCDSPGIYVFDTVGLKWSAEYKALDTDEEQNPQNQQLSQKGDSSGLAGSYGYQVPGSVQKVIGGNEQGSATITAPAQTPAGGPFATGLPKTYPVDGDDAYETRTVLTTSTDASGAVHTGTTISTVPTGGRDGSGSGGGVNVPAVAAGVVAGVLFLVAAYMAWCAWMYRRHLSLYKRHVAMAQRASLGLEAQNKNLLFPGPERSSADTRPRPSDERSTSSRHGRGRQGYTAVPTGDTPPVPKLKEGTSGPTSGESSSKKDDSASISSTEDMLNRGEPSFMGVILNPRRTLRVVNQ